jgi:hypothetical protein
MGKPVKAAPADPLASYRRQGAEGSGPLAALPAQRPDNAAVMPKLRVDHQGGSHTSAALRI